MKSLIALNETQTSEMELRLSYLKKKKPTLINSLPSFHHP